MATVSGLITDGGHPSAVLTNGAAGVMTLTLTGSGFSGGIYVDPAPPAMTNHYLDPANPNAKGAGVYNFPVQAGSSYVVNCFGYNYGVISYSLVGT
jgi:expansin (peptidoglycan-binding protein)